MKVLNIGELIRQRRIECGFSQEELCYGICEQPTMSRIENGTTTPSRSKLTALLQRLGMPSEKYYALLSENELEVMNLQSEIMTCMVQRNAEDGLAKVERLEQLVEEDDHILKQFILRSRVAFGKRVGNNIEKYTFNECIALLHEAIKLTVPRFTIENISNYLLGTDEIQIVNQIAKIYTDENQYIEAISIYSRLLNYLEIHSRTLNQDSYCPSVAILIAYNYSRSLYFNDQYLEAIIIADIGLNYTKELRNSSYLGSLLFVKAHCLFHLHDTDTSRTIFLQSYYVYKATGDFESANYVSNIIQQLFKFMVND